MKRKFLKFINFTFVFLLLSFVAVAQDAAQKADELVNAYMKLGGFSGSVLVSQNGKKILSKGYGMANYELDVPNKPDTKFRIGSVTKQFTATAVMQLAERGALKLEDPLSKYVPEYPKDVADKITIHHLLTHTSGIFNYTRDPEFFKNMRVKMSLTELIAKFKDKPLDFEPGTKFNYSNSGYILLTVIVEKASGKPYEQFLKENIFQPLGMNNTGYDYTEPILKNRAAGYGYEGGKIKNADYLDMSLPAGAGALYSTTEDLYLWDRALYTEKLVKKATMDKIFTTDKNNYAYGWIVDEQFKHKRITHNGGINGFNSHIARFVNDDVCIVVLSNRIPSAASKIGKDLAAILFGEKYELPVERKTIAVDHKILDTYVGEYQLEPNFILTVTREGNSLMTQATGQSKVEVFAETETRFFLTVTKADIVFVKNEKGEVTGLILYQGGREMPAKKIK